MRDCLCTYQVSDSIGRDGLVQTSKLEELVGDHARDRLLAGISQSFQPPDSCLPSGILAIGDAVVPTPMINFVPLAENRHPV